MLCVKKIEFLKAQQLFRLFIYCEINFEIITIAIETAITVISFNYYAHVEQQQLLLRFHNNRDFKYVIIYLQNICRINKNIKHIIIQSFSIENNIIWKALKVSFLILIDSKNIRVFRLKLKCSRMKYIYLIDI